MGEVHEHVDRTGVRAAPRRSPAHIIGEADLAAFYRAISLAQHDGFFAHAHGPLEDTAWLHVTARIIEELDTAATRAVFGELHQLRRIQAMTSGRPTTGPRRIWLPDSLHRDEPYVAVRDPTAVAVAATLLSRLDHDRHWPERIAGIYAGGVVAIEQGFRAAEAYLRRQIDARAFEGAVRASNGYGGMERHAHKPHDLAHDTVDPLATPIGKEMAAVFETARRHTDVEIPDLLEALAQSIGAPDEPGTPQLPLQLLARSWDRVVSERDRRSQPRPRETPRTGDRDLCREGQPQHGGRWEIAHVNATDTAPTCPPADALDKASSRFYGDAGASLIRAQNEWINAKECFRKTDTDRCLRKEDHGHEQCLEERDDGYERCDREEDQGHNECCDWAPCSWFCDVLVWIRHVVCVASTWIENIVCVVSKWLEKWVCILWDYAQAIGCALGHLAVAGGNIARGLGGIFAGGVARTIAGGIAGACRLVGWGGRTTTSDSLKVVGVHIAVLHTGKVLLFSYDEGVQPVTEDDPADFTAIGDSDRALCALWDPATGDARYVELGRNLFCSHHAFAPSGELFVAGGQFPLPGLLKSLFWPRLLAPGADRDVHLFDPVTEQWRRLADMDFGRWYPTCATMPDGRIFVIAGTNGWATEGGFGRGIQDSYEVADPSSRTVGHAVGLSFHLYYLYPFVLTLPSGKIFVHSRRTTHLFDPVSLQWERVAPKLKMSGGKDLPGDTNNPHSRTGPGPGTCVLLPLEPTRNWNGEISYPAGRVLILGGGGLEGEGEPTSEDDGSGNAKLNSYTPATATAEILDFAESDPYWRWTAEEMHYGRVMTDSILLPTGKVLVVGGGQKGQSGGLLAHFTSSDVEGRPNKGATDPVHEPELFDPETETWAKLCPKPIERLYHTTAVLLPDARVLVAGHDGALNMAPYDRSRYELELFSPPYLFAADGTLALRPVVTTAPSRISYGEAFSVTTPEPGEIERVALIRQGSTTHQTNTDQRYVGLFILDRLDGKLQLAAPTGGGVAPPGHYMLFLVDRAGVPSVARWVQVGPPM